MKRVHQKIVVSKFLAKAKEGERVQKDRGAGWKPRISGFFFYFFVLREFSFSCLLHRIKVCFKYRLVPDLDITFDYKSGARFWNFNYLYKSSLIGGWKTGWIGLSHGERTSQKTHGGGVYMCKFPRRRIKRKNSVDFQDD